MSVKMESIDIYNNSAIIRLRETPKKIISWITILIMLLVILAILFQIPFNIFKNYKGLVVINNNETYISLVLNGSDFPIDTNDELYIGSKKYSYELINIDKYNVLIKIDLDEKFKINNNIVIINIVKEKTTVFKIIKKKIKKGFDL